MKDLFMTFYNAYCANIALWDSSDRSDKDININILRQECCGALTLALFLDIIDTEEFNDMLYDMLEESSTSC